MSEKKLNEAAYKKAYFKEVADWDKTITEQIERSEKRAWWVAGSSVLVAILAIVAVVLLSEPKTVEPFVVRVDNNTGYVDVVSTLTETDGEIKEEAQEVLDKYWLAKYIKHREGYHFATRNYDRSVVALLSSPVVQEQYAAYTDPKLNPNAPVMVYGENAEVIIGAPSISFINTGEIVKNEKRITALVRYTKKVVEQGAFTPQSHWAATVTFVYRSIPMAVEDRLINPLGFQVVSYRNDQEAPSEH
jgi:type IV secretion system protein VirB8